jgi:hypothetical protein
MNKRIPAFIQFVFGSIFKTGCDIVDTGERAGKDTLYRYGHAWYIWEKTTFNFTRLQPSRRNRVLRKHHENTSNKISKGTASVEAHKMTEARSGKSSVTVSP